MVGCRERGCRSLYLSNLVSSYQYLHTWIHENLVSFYRRNEQSELLPSYVLGNGVSSY